MGLHMKIILILCCLGGVLSIGATAFSFMQYLAISYEEKAMHSLKPDVGLEHDPVIHKLESLLEGHRAKDVVLKELRSRAEYGESMYAALYRLMSESRERALFGAILWVGTGVIFFLVVLLTESGLRQGRKGKGK
jgi:hypothetical protein